MRSHSKAPAARLLEARVAACGKAGKGPEKNLNWAVFRSISINSFMAKDALSELILLMPGGLQAKMKL
jgi:hypothetical protein